MTKAGCPGDDRTDLFLTDFAATEAENFTRDILNLGHVQTESHQLGADCHQAAAHQSRDTAAVVRGSDGSFRARNLFDQGLNFLGRTFVAKEIQDEADGFFGHSLIEAGLYSQLPNQFVHICPPSSGLVPDAFLGNYLDLPRNELQATTALEAVIQLRSRGECCSNARAGANFAANCSQGGH